MSDSRIDELVAEATARHYSRRQILKRAAALGLSAPAISLVLAACGGEDDTGEPAGTGSTPSGASASPAAGTAGTGAPAGDTGGIINANTTLGDKGIGNPILNGGDYWTEWLVFSKLVKYDDHGELIPDLAKDWSYSEDGLTLTLSLVETSWHDGTPFTSADVLFTFDTIKDENVDTPYGSRLQVEGAYVAWEAPDERTVVITMPSPFAPFLFGLSQIAILPKHLLEGSADINTDPFNTSPIGTGPYKFVERQPDQYVR